MKLPTSELLDAHMTAMAQELTELESAYAEQVKAFEEALIGWESSKQHYEEQIETLSKKYDISRSVTLVVTTVALATILAYSLQMSKD